MEMIISLMQTKNLPENKKIKILVTGPKISVDSLADELHQLRKNLDAGKYDLIKQTNIK